MSEDILPGEESQEYSLATSYWAKVLDGVVVDVIVASEHYIMKEFVDSSPGKWIETSKDGSIRKNYASRGHFYDASRDAFYRRQPFPSWVLNEDTCRWEAPIARPDDGAYNWDEENQSWSPVESE